jgi:hypothetical protein
MKQQGGQKMALNGGLDFSDPWWEVLEVQMKERKIWIGS